MHIDNYIDDEEANPYISFFFYLHRLRAGLRIRYKAELASLKLYCTYGDKRYRVVGASSLGDIFLSRLGNEEFDNGYDLRVDFDDCFLFSKEAKFSYKTALPCYINDPVFTKFKVGDQEDFPDSFGKFVLVNDHGKDLSFSGKLLGEAKEIIDSIQTNLFLYLTDKGHYVCLKEIRVPNNRLEPVKSQVCVARSNDSIMEFFGYKKLAKSLYNECGIDYVDFI